MKLMELSWVGLAGDERQGSVTRSTDDESILIFIGSRLSEEKMAIFCM
jgi:hypothetical protein